MEDSKQITVNKGAAFRLAGRDFCIPEAHFVLQSSLGIQLPPRGEVPAYTRGGFLFHGALSAFVDLRICLGLPSVLDEQLTFRKEVDEQKKTLGLWLAGLQKALTEGRIQEVSYDPAKTPLGAWLNTLRFSDPALFQMLEKLKGLNTRLCAAAEEQAFACNRFGELQKAQKLLLPQISVLLNKLSGLYPGKPQYLVDVPHLLAFAIDEPLPEDGDYEDISRVWSGICKDFEK